MYLLSIDFGTSAVKLSVTDEAGHVLGWAKEGYPYLLLPGEKVEMSPDALWKALFAAASRLDEGLRSQVELLCYDTFSPSPVFLDQAGELDRKSVV